MLILSPADRAALWHQTITSDTEDRPGMLRVLAKEMQDLVAGELELYSGWEEHFEATLRLLDAMGLIGRDDLRRSFEVLNVDEEGAVSPEEFVLRLAGALEEGVAFPHVDGESRQQALVLADAWRELVRTEELEQSPPEWATVAEVAAHFGVTPQAVYKWCEAGKVSFERTPGGSYRIPVEQFDWDRGKATQGARREIATRLAVKLAGTPVIGEEDVAEAVRGARREG